MKRVLILGRSSYIGTAFADYAAKWSGGYLIKTVGTTDKEWETVDFSGYDSLLYVAGIAHSDSKKISPERAKEYYEINTALTAGIAKKAKLEGVKQFIFMSSMIVYGVSRGIGQDGIINESTVPAPENSYGDSKLQAEHALQAIENKAFKVVIIRSPMVYGEGCKGNYPLLSKFARVSPIFPYIKNRRSMVYVGNLLEFIRLMVDNRESGIFYPQNAEHVDTGEMLKLIAECHHKKLYLIPIPGFVIAVLAKLFPVARKVYGDFAYDPAMSRYPTDYRLFSLRESIIKTEGGDGE